MKHYADIGIVGAGPAGARAAELLATLGARVVLLDPKAPWEKPCGGGLTPSAFQEIPELEELKPEARSVNRVRIETGPEKGFTVPLDHPMWILSRQTLSSWQLDRAVAAGAEHLKVKVRSAHRLYGGWRLETGGGDLAVSLLVGADGAASLVRKVAAPKLRVELAPTRVAYARDAGPTPDTAILRFYPSVSGYLWDFPRPDHRSVGIGVPNRTWGRAVLDREIDGYRASSERCDCPGLERAGAVIGTAQLGHGDFSKVAGRDFGLLGDAAGFADPFTGEGIQNALRSAELLAAAWAGNGSFDAYPGLARKAFERGFGVARFLRGSLLESESGARLINSCTTSKLRYGAVAAVVNAINEHDGGFTSFLWRWARAYKAVQRDPALAGRVGRVPVPCACSPWGVPRGAGDCCSAPIPP